MMKIAEKIRKGQAPRLAFLGDSVTQGMFEFQNGFKESALRPEKAFHNLLKEKIKRELGQEIVVINAGIGGNFSGQGLARMQADVIDKKPDFCCVMFGTNDVTNARKGVAALNEYEKNMRTIFQRLLDTGIEPVLLTPGMLASHHVKGFTGFWFFVHKYYEYLQNSGKMDQYVECARQVARDMGIPIADAYAVWKDMAKRGIDTTAMLINGLNHPAAEYHQIFCDCLYQTIFS